MPENQSDIILLFFIGGVTGPIAEEVFFRGILYGFFRKWDLWMALVLSTLIFVAAHLGPTGFRLSQLAGGIIFAVSYELGGSLIVPITIHVLGNLAMYTLSLII
jgi:membrane protease YdiL (CAAX protease family)